MAKDGSVAPKERINVVYKSSTGDAQESVELPLKMLFLGDYTGKPDSRPVEDRKPIKIDKDTFNQVMAEQKLGVDVSVKNTLAEKGGGDMNLSLQFRNLKDFTPEGIAEQIPEVKQLLEVRKALTVLKGPLGNIPAFRKKIQSLIGDNAGREKLMTELGLSNDEEKGA